MKQRTKTLILSVIALCIALAIAVGAIFVVTAYSDKQYASLHEGCHQN
jgi:ABC-type phosphate transport system permease subunit